MSGKIHPKSVMLIEPDTARMWRLVMRETTCTGLKPGFAPMLSQHPNKHEARGHLVWIKQKPKECGR